MLQHGLDLNANVTYTVLITKQNNYPTNTKHFYDSMLTLYCVMLCSQQHFENLAANAA